MVKYIDIASPFANTFPYRARAERQAFLMEWLRGVCHEPSRLVESHREEARRRDRIENHTGREARSAANLQKHLPGCHSTSAGCTSVEG